MTFGLIGTGHGFVDGIAQLPCGVTVGIGALHLVPHLLGHHDRESKLGQRIVDTVVGSGCHALHLGEDAIRLGIASRRRLGDAVRAAMPDAA